MFVSPEAMLRSFRYPFVLPALGFFPFRMNFGLHSKYVHLSYNSYMPRLESKHDRGRHSIGSAPMPANYITRSTYHAEAKVRSPLPNSVVPRHWRACYNSRFAEILGSNIANPLLHDRAHSHSSMLCFCNNLAD